MRCTSSQFSPFSRHSGSGRGMTFIEIMIVIVIFGVLMALAVPSMSKMHNRNKFSAAAREMTNVLRYARQQAVLRHNTTEVLFWIEKNEYKLDMQPPDTVKKKSYSSRRRSSDPMENTRKVDPKHKRTIIEEITSGDTDKRAFQSKNRDAMRVRFYRNGSATPATILLRYDRKSKDETGKNKFLYMTVQVAGATGAVRVITGKPTDTEIEIPEWGVSDKNQNTQAGGEW